MNRSIPLEPAERPDINLTPMLDVVFILLIFFVVTASFIKDFGLEIALPLGIVPPPEDVPSITVTVERGSTFHVNGRPLSRGSLAPYIRRLRSESPDASLAVLVASDSVVDDTVAAVDAARRAGYGRVPVSPLE